MGDLAETALWARGIIAVGIVISAGEFLTIRKQFGAGGMFDWTVLQTRFKAPSRRAFARTRDLVLGPAFTAVLVTEIVLALALAIPGRSDLYYLVVAAAALAAFVLTMSRAMFGGDGSDQMTVIVLAGLIVYAAIPAGSALKPLGLWFIAAQTVLSYETSGIAKLISPVWRNGTAAPLIFTTATYGARWLSRLLRRYPPLGPVLTWSVILFESTFVIALFAPTPVLIGYLAVGIAFHVGNAVVMGLNTFFWAFVATYPAVILCNREIASLLHR